MHSLLEFKKRVFQLFRIEVIGLGYAEGLEVGAVSD